MNNRTALLTAGSVVAVVLAAIAALALNVGIFDRASSSDVGQLTAADLETAATDTTADPGAATDSAADPGAAATDTASANPQLIEVAGIATVSVSTTSGAATDELTIDGVDAERGWDWEIFRPAPDAAEIHFTDGSQTQIVTLTSAAGQVSARLRSGDPAPAATSSSASDDDEHEDDEHEDDDDEEHEGGEDDD